VLLRPHQYHCNGSTVLFGLPQHLVVKIQCVQNAAGPPGRLIHAARIRDRSSVHCGCIFNGCGLLTVSRFGWRYSPTAAFTVQHLSTCRNNCSEFLRFTHVDDFVLRRPLFGLFRVPVAQSSAVEVSHLVRPHSGTAGRQQSVLHHICRCSGSL